MSKLQTAEPMPPGALSINIASQTVWLLPHAALYWPDRKVLFVADVHLGKAASFRQQGQPVPQGTTTDTLNRLSAAIDATQARHLVVLGDFMHSAAIKKSVPTLAAIGAWRARHSAMHLTLIRGNHDQQAGDPDPGFAIEVVSEPWVLDPFDCRHEPPVGASDRFWLAGHVHPVFTLKSRAGDKIRLTGFALSQSGIVLPAFGAFTGGYPYALNPDDACFVIAQDEVLKIPRQAVHTRRKPAQRDVRALLQADYRKDYPDTSG